MCDPVEELRKVGRGFGSALDSAMSFIARSVDNFLKNPLPTIETAILINVGVPPPVAAAAVTAANGGDVKQIALSAAVAYAAGEIGAAAGSEYSPIETQTLQQLGPQYADELLMKQIITSASATAAATALRGGSMDQILTSAVSGAIAPTVSTALKDQYGMSGFDNRVISSSVAAATKAILSGKSAGQAISDSLVLQGVSQGIQNTVDIIKQNINAVDDNNAKANENRKIAEKIYNDTIKPNQELYQTSVASLEKNNPELMSLIRERQDSQDRIYAYLDTIPPDRFATYDFNGDPNLQALHAQEGDVILRMAPLVTPEAKTLLENAGAAMKAVNDVRGEYQASITRYNTYANNAKDIGESIKHWSYQLDSQVDNYKQQYANLTGKSLDEAVSDEALKNLVSSGATDLTESQQKDFFKQIENGYSASEAYHLANGTSDSNAQALGFKDFADQSSAKAAGYTDAEKWQAWQDRQNEIAKAYGFNDVVDQKAARDAGFSFGDEWHAAQEKGFSNRPDYWASLFGFKNAADQQAARDAGFSFGDEWHTAQEKGFSNRPDYWASLFGFKNAADQQAARDAGMFADQFYAQKNHEDILNVFRDVLGRDPTPEEYAKFAGENAINVKQDIRNTIDDTLLAAGEGFNLGQGSGVDKFGFNNDQKKTISDFLRSASQYSDSGITVDPEDGSYHVNDPSNQRAYQFGTDGSYIGSRPSIEISDEKTPTSPEAAALISEIGPIIQKYESSKDKSSVSDFIEKYAGLLGVGSADPLSHKIGLFGSGATGWNTDQGFSIIGFDNPFVSEAEKQKAIQWVDLVEKQLSEKPDATQEEKTIAENLKKYVEANPVEKEKTPVKEEPSKTGESGLQGEQGVSGGDTSGGSGTSASGGGGESITKEEAKQALQDAGITNPTSEQIQELIDQYKQQSGGTTGGTTGATTTGGTTGETGGTPEGAIAETTEGTTGETGGGTTGNTTSGATPGVTGGGGDSGAAEGTTGDTNAIAGGTTGGTSGTTTGETTAGGATSGTTGGSTLSDVSGGGTASGIGTGEGTGSGTGTGTAYGGSGTGTGAGTGAGTGGSTAGTGTGSGGTGTGSGSGTGGTGTASGGTGGTSTSGGSNYFQNLSAMLAPAAVVAAAETETPLEHQVAKIKGRGDYQGLLMPFLKEVGSGDYLTDNSATDNRTGDLMTPTYFNYGSEAPIDQIMAGGDQQTNDEPQLPYAMGGAVSPLMGVGTRYGQYASGGMATPLMAAGGKMRVDFRQGDAVTGPGDGQSDDIPAMLADGEFVIPADVVAAIGNGSTKAGSDKLYDMMHGIRKHVRSAHHEDLPPEIKSPLDFLKTAPKKGGKKHG